MKLPVTCQYSQLGRVVDEAIVSEAQRRVQSEAANAAKQTESAPTSYLDLEDNAETAVAPAAVPCHKLHLDAMLDVAADGARSVYTLRACQLYLTFFEADYSVL